MEKFYLKILQKNIKKYFELHINEWWNINIGSHIFKHYNSSKQRYSKEKMEASFENPSLKIVPYYIVNDGIYNMILCLRGSLIKGHPNLNKNPPQEIKIEKSFLLGETEITQELYYAVMGTKPSDFQNEPKNPVENVSWYDAVMFCNRLSDIFDLDRYYTITKDGKIIDTIKSKYPNMLLSTEDQEVHFALYFAEPKTKKGAVVNPNQRPNKPNPNI